MLWPSAGTSITEAVKSLRGSQNGRGRHLSLQGSRGGENLGFCPFHVSSPNWLTFVISRQWNDFNICIFFFRMGYILDGYFLHKIVNIFTNQHAFSIWFSLQKHHLHTHKCKYFAKWCPLHYTAKHVVQKTKLNNFGHLMCGYFLFLSY